MSRFFVYDPNCGYEEFDNVEDRDKAAHEYIQNYLDDGWNEEVAGVVAGVVTHNTVQVNRQERPHKLDEDDCDEDGQYWGDFDYICDYELHAIEANDEIPNSDME